MLLRWNQHIASPQVATGTPTSFAAPSGHTRLQRLQPTHSFLSTFAIPSFNVIAVLAAASHAFTHKPHPVHSSSSIVDETAGSTLRSPYLPKYLRLLPLKFLIYL